jgi:hypothetical protein
MNSHAFKLGYTHFNGSIVPINLDADYLDGWFYVLGVRLAEDKKPLYTCEALRHGYGYGIYLETLRSK